MSVQEPKLASGSEDRTIELWGQDGFRRRHAAVGAGGAFCDIVSPKESHSMFCGSPEHLFEMMCSIMRFHERE